MSQLQLFDGYAIYGPGCILEGKVLFGFDLDHTIIRPQVGTFYKGVTDWEFVPGMDGVLKTLSRVGVVALFTNQGGVAAGKTTIAEVVARIDAVMKKVGVEFLAFMALSPQYRKPSPMLFRELIYGYMPEYTRGFYCGDASSEDDFADTDYRFALNTGLDYIPVTAMPRVFMDAHVGAPAVDTVTAELTPHVLHTRLTRPPVREYIVPGAVIPVPNADTSILVITVGPPGCGKSTYAKSLGCLNLWTHISRDALGTAAKCVTALKRAIAHPRVIIDATHPDVQSREPFIKIARAAGMHICAVVFTPPIEVAKYMNRVRAITGGNYVPDIAYGMFAKRYVAPTIAEGFAQIIMVNQIPQTCPDEYLDWYL